MFFRLWVKFHMTHVPQGMFTKLSIKLIYSHYHFVRLIGLKIEMLQLEELLFGRTWLNLWNITSLHHKNKSYDLLVQSHTDCLMFAKRQFFHDIAIILSEFSTKFQTDNPVMPFHSDLLESSLRRLIKSFILAKVIKAAATT